MKVLLFLMVLLTALLVYVFGASPSGGSDTLRIGYAYEPPYTEINDQGIVGGVFPTSFLKLHERISEKPLEWVLLSFEQLIPALTAGRIDVIASGMTVSQERAERVCFTVPLVESDTGFLYLSENSRYNDELPISEQKLTYAVIKNSVEEEMLKGQIKQVDLLSIEDAHLGLFAVRQKHADIFIMTLPTLKYLASLSPGEFKVVRRSDVAIRTQHVSFVFRQEDAGKVAEWNRYQAEWQKTEEFVRQTHEMGFNTFDLSYEQEQGCYL